MVLGIATAGRAEADVPLPGTQPEQFADPDAGFYPLWPSVTCRSCHAGTQDTPLPHGPYEWAGSTMGNAAIDPVFLAALSISEDDQPGIGDLCLRCHAPEAWLEGRSTPTDGSALDSLRDDGVTCHLCHRIVPEDPLGLDPDGPYIGNARWFITREYAMRGPYDDVILAPHPTVQDPFLAEAAYCGVCHDVSNPLVPWLGTEGQQLGTEFPLERTYSEWLRSAYPAEGETCQTCHMEPFEGRVCNIAGSLPRTIYVHQLAGANTWMPQALQFIWGDDLQREDLWATSIEATREMLATAAELSFARAPEVIAPGSTLSFAVRVTNLTGHKLPTGFPEGRRLWLEVVVDDAAGDPILESGTYDHGDATRLEDEQLRTYEVVLGVVGEGESLHFARNDVILADTRIPPRGFDPQPDDSGIEPVGRDYTDAQGVMTHWDDAPYEVRVACDEIGPLRVKARLLLQIASREYIEFLRDSQVTELGRERGETLHDAWEQTGKSTPEVLGELETTIAVEGPCGTPDDSGPGDGGQQDGGTGGTGDGCCAVVPGAGGRGSGVVLLGLFGVVVATARTCPHRPRGGERPIRSSR